MSDLPGDVIDYWLCLEFLNPQRIGKQDPAKEIWDAGADAELPWNEPRRKLVYARNRPDKQWRHSISFGILSMPCLMKSLKGVLGVGDAPDQEDLDVRGEAATIIINTDFRGHPIGEVSFSSLPWAMGRLSAAGRGKVDFTGFGGLEGFEAGLKAKLQARLTAEHVLAPADPKGEVKTLRPLTFADIRILETVVYGECGWDPAGCLSTRIQSKSFQARPNLKPDADTDLLNSFIAPDMLKVKEFLAGRRTTKGLEMYLGQVPPGKRVDLRSKGGFEKVLEGTMPAMLSIGCWPSRHPLSLAQQFAVNRISADLSALGGIFSVNGPPGTGKTTLLRDVVADIVVQRAVAMAAFGDASGAFSSREPLRFNADRGLWTVPPSLSGFGIVVASSNNGAVENISKELPARKSFDIPGPVHDYFADVADGLVADRDAKARKPGSAWGTIAAVLGNRENCIEFAHRFWSSDDAQEQAMQPGGNAFIRFRDALASSPALPWTEIREAFLAAKRAAEEAIASRQKQAEVLDRLFAVQADLAEVDDGLSKFGGQLDGMETLHRSAIAAAAAASAAHGEVAGRTAAFDAFIERSARFRASEAAMPEGDLDLLAEAIEADVALGKAAESGLAGVNVRLADLRLVRPGFLSRLFGTSASKVWTRQFGEALQEQATHETATRERKTAADMAREAHAKLSQWARGHASIRLDLEESRSAASAVYSGTLPSPAEAKGALDRSVSEMERADRAVSRISAERKPLLDASAELEHKRKRLSSELSRLTVAARGLGADAQNCQGWNLRACTEEERQKSAAWHDDKLSELRQKVFLAALDLHKSFIQANREAAVENLGLLVDVLTGKLSRKAVVRRLGELWDTFFLVIPVVSTAFASVARLFDGLEEGSIGWLVIDEAGQATPQAALGAIWRATRTVVVGDPLQIEPVVPIPEAAIDMVRVKFGVGHDWHPIRNSTQVLADRANPWGTELVGKWIGSPLRVHRRCLDPMFTVSNRIAYDGMMVHGTIAGKDTPAWLGDSQWIHVPSVGSAGHWIPDEGKVAAKIVELIIARAGSAFTPDKKPNVYVISPFKDVARGMQELLLGGLGKQQASSITGTVHTFQGKEAEVVVLVLGGNPSRPGAITGFAAKQPNLLNVAITRAKTRLYVIGDHDRWSKANFYSSLSAALHADGRPGCVSAEEFFREVGSMRVLSQLPTR